MRGERKLKAKSGSAQAKAFRVRAAHTVGDTRRLIDYLVTRPDIARTELSLRSKLWRDYGQHGRSFDERIRAAALIYAVAICASYSPPRLPARWELEVPAYLLSWYSERG